MKIWQHCSRPTDDVILEPNFLLTVFNKTLFQSLQVRQLYTPIAIFGDISPNLHVLPSELICLSFGYQSVLNIELSKRFLQRV
jgi:hypothetical protein